MSRASIATCLASAISLAILDGCGAPAPPPPAVPVPIRPAFKVAIPTPAGSNVAPVPAISLEQGWTPELIRAWYWRPQGSQIVPYDWFLALEQVGSEKPFRGDDLIDRFRYLPEAPGPNNPDGLPVGFARGNDPSGRPWIGLTCAACHTGQVEYRGKRVRIEGGPALGDLGPFRDEMIAAFRATLGDDAKFARFASKILKDDKEPEKAKALRDEVRAYSDGMAQQADRGRPEHPAGFGRLDVASALMNEMLGTVAGEPANDRRPIAPVSYPPLWDAARLEWTGWNGSMQDPIARNVGKVLIVGGRAEATAKDDDVSIRSTAKVKNLIDLEEWTKTLTPPRWPEEVLGRIDRKEARLGAEVYRKAGCAACHADRPPYPESAPNKSGKTFIKVARTPLADVKTDPLMAENFLGRTAKPGKFARLFPGAAEVPAWQMLNMGLVKLVEGDLPAAGLDSEQAFEASGFREATTLNRDELLAYKAGPLAGTWATAPYLHNGSVPSLYQLLLPPDQRIKVFHVGSREFDPKDVGFATGPAADAFEFRTEIPGNANSGHDYGTTLTDDDRRALIEYLKTL